MRKLKMIKVVAPELVAYITCNGEEKIPDYVCPECGGGVAEGYISCPYCGAELDWKRKSEESKEFQKLMEQL